MKNFSSSKTEKPVVYGKAFSVPRLRLRITEITTKKRLANKEVNIRYVWRWFEYPYEDRPLGIWSDSYDLIQCNTDASGEIVVPQYEVIPRGWYKGPVLLGRTPEFKELEVSVDNHHVWMTRRQIESFQKPGKGKVVTLSRPDRFQGPYQIEALSIHDADSREDDAPRGQPAPGHSKTEQQLVLDSVRSFLSVWLIEGATDKAVLFFGNAAFQNEEILVAPCASYIKPDERSSEKARRAGVNKFLRDFTPTERKTSLSEILNREAIVPLVAQMGSKVINDANVDLFVLAKLGREELPIEESKEADYLRKHLPASFYASFVSVEEGMIYLLWVPEGKTWKIYHASLVCM